MRLVLALACLLVSGSISAANECVSGTDAEARADFLQRRLDRASRAAKIWTGSWVGVFSALAIGGAVLAPLSEPSERPDYYFTTGKSLIGVAAIATAPLRAIDGARRLRSRSRDDLCSLVAEGERLLQLAARSEAEGRRLYVHLGNLALNFGSLLVLGLVFERWEAAALQGLGGSLIGELMIVTRPHVAEDALEDYRAGRLDRSAKAGTIPLAAVPLILPSGGGLALGGSF